MDEDRRPLFGWIRLLTGHGPGAAADGGSRRSGTPLDATLRELFLQEEAKNELFLNSVILFGLIPLLVLVSGVIAVIEKFNLNSTFNLACLALAAPYYLSMHVFLRRGAFPASITTRGFPSLPGFSAPPPTARLCSMAFWQRKSHSPR